MEFFVSPSNAITLEFPLAILMRAVPYAALVATWNNIDQNEIEIYIEANQYCILHYLFPRSEPILQS